MNTDEIITELHQYLTDAGFKSSVVSIRHLPALQSDLENLLAQRILNRDFYNDIISRYDLQWQFEPLTDFAEATSVIITAVRQPKVSVKFKSSGTIDSTIIPPTYLHDTDEKALNIIATHLGNHGYKVSDALLPTKLLAVHCGLARYGKNNIAYIDGWGSFFRLRAYFSDIPCTADNWQDVQMMKLCEKCVACVKNCPTGAISDSRFLICGEKCITYFNEGTDGFPEWIDPSWHNCLIGCMICQDVCPANKEHTGWIVPGGEFSEEETQLIMKGVPKDKLPLGTAEKLKKLCMWDWYNLLQRNLGMLIESKT